MASTSITTFTPSYWHTQGKEPLSPLTVGQLVDIAAEKWADREALVSLYQNQRFTFQEVRDKVDKLAAGLLQLGLDPGDRVAVWGPNSIEWYFTRLAAARAGFIIVQLDPAYQPPQLLHGLTKVDVKALIFAETFKTNSYYEMIRSLIPELDNCPESGVELKSTKVPSLKILVSMNEKQFRGSYRFQDIVSSAKAEFLKKIRDLQTIIQPDEGAAIQYSSGTTGNPKAVLTSHHNLVNNSIDVGKRMEMDLEHTRTLTSVQLCHVSGSIVGIICSILYGSALIIPIPTFEAKAIVLAIEKERCTNIIATPSLYVDMISNAQSLGLSFTTLRIAGYGGAPCSQQLTIQMKETFNVNRLCPVYGMTEIGIVTAGLPTDNLQKMTSTVGFTSDHLELKVVDREGNMVPMGTPGELWARGYSVMLRYWGDEEKTRALIGPDGWVKTGDQFVLHENGYGMVVGRLKDMIIRIADNIFPAELEDFFLRHPDILEAQVFGVPDPKVGEEICTYLRLKAGVTLTEKDIVNYCKDKIADYRIPRYIRFVETYPKTSIGKVQKFRLLEMLQKELSIK